MKPPSLASQKKLVDKINSTYSVGSKVDVRQDDGTIATWTIEHEATIMGGHTAVIWCKEHSGCYNADRVVF